MARFPRPPRPAGQELDQPGDGESGDAQPGHEESAQPVWKCAPEDVLAGVVPVELVLGRSSSTVVLLTGIRAFPTGLSMSLGVRVRSRGRAVHPQLYQQVFNKPHHREQGPSWRPGQLTWGFELADGRRASNVDPAPWSEQPTGPDGTPDVTWLPSRPVLIGAGGHAGARVIEGGYWLWPLPPPGPVRVVCQWLERGIEHSAHELDGEAFQRAAQRARPIWPQP